MTWPLSLCTSCSPWLPVEQLMPVCAAAGITGLDVAVKAHRFDPAKPINCWANNAAVVDQDRLEERLPSLKAAFQQYGLSCRMLSSYTRSDQLAEAKRLAAAAVALNSPEVRIGVPVPQAGKASAQVQEARSNWRELAAIGKAHGIRFVLELHNRTITTGASGAMRVLEGLDPAHVGVIFDIANTAIEGNEPLPVAIELLGPYMTHVHVKDLVLQQSTLWHGCDYGMASLGHGSMRWAECLRILREKGYTGWLALENFADLDRGPTRLAEDAAWLRARIAESQIAQPAS